MTEFDHYARQYEALLRDPIRDRFEGSAGFFHRRKWELIEAFLDRRGWLHSGRAWLDVGCGKGELLALGRHRFSRVAGCDPSREMASGAAVEVRLQERADVLPFEDGSFDLVTAVCVYHHVKEAIRPALTREIRRLLRPGGICCIIEHNPFNPVTQIIVKRSPVDTDASLLSSGTAAACLREAGCSVIGRQYFLYFPERVYGRLARVERALASFPLGGQYAVFGTHRAPTLSESRSR